MCRVDSNWDDIPHEKAFFLRFLIYYKPPRNEFEDWEVIMENGKPKVN